jgi:RNA polymerase sigma factor (sigma-70 family)
MQGVSKAGMSYSIDDDVHDCSAPVNAFTPCFLPTDAPVGESVMSLHLEITDLRPNPEDHYIQCENQGRLESAISRLPASYRRVFEIRLRSDGPMKEVADEVGITVGATKSRFLRARKALRSSLW